MRILHTVEFYAPSVGGMAEAVRQISERMVKKGHEVTVATGWMEERKFTEHNGVQVRGFKVSGSHVRGYEGDTQEYCDFLLNSKFDVTVNFQAQQWATDLALPLLKKIHGKKAAVPTGYSYLYNPAYEDYYKQMETWAKAYDATIYLSKEYRDYDWGEEHKIGRAVVIANGAAEDEFLELPKIDIHSRMGIRKNALLVLHVGSHSTVKGHREAMGIFKEAKLRNAVLLIVGNEPPFGGCIRRCFRHKKRYNYNPLRLLDRNKIVVTELKRPETLAAYAAADLFLFPSQIECSPIVIFEAMASKTPFLATKVGNIPELARFGSGELMGGTEDEDCFTHANIEAGAKQLKALALDPAKRSEMATKGFEAWRSRFTWEEVANQYEQLYKSL